MFHLRYTLSAPFDAVITAGAMRKYEELFSYLWRLKRVEYTLNRTWATHMRTGQQCAHEVDPRMCAILHRSRMQLREMRVASLQSIAHSVQRPQGVGQDINFMSPRFALILGYTL